MCLYLDLFVITKISQTLLSPLSPLFLQSASLLARNSLTINAPSHLFQTFLEASHKAAIAHRPANQSILNHIRLQRVADVAWARARVPLTLLTSRLSTAPPLKDFAAALTPSPDTAVVLLS